jgi:hypothetical protein
LLVGTPRPAQSGDWAVAVPAAARLMQLANATAMMPRTMRPRLLELFMLLPS